MVGRSSTIASGAHRLAGPHPAEDSFPAVHGYDPARPFYSFQFYRELGFLLAGSPMPVQSDWSTNRLVLRIEADEAGENLPDGFTYYVLGPGGELLTILDDQKYLGQAQTELTKLYGVDPQDIAVLETPLLYEIHTTQGENKKRSLQHVVVLQLKRLPTELVPKDWLEHETEMRLSSFPHPRLTPLKKQQRIIEAAYLISRYGQRDLGPPPILEYSDVALIQAFARLHPNADDIREAMVRYTPIVTSPLMARMVGALSVLIKDESEQYTQSFKPRGAGNKLLYELEQALQALRQQGDVEASVTAIAAELGVVAASHGNHAQGVVWASQQLGFKKTVLVLPLHDQTQKNKIRKCLEMGAIVVLHGLNLQEAMAMAQKINRDGLQLFTESAHFLAANASDHDLDRAFRAGRITVMAGDPALAAATVDEVKASVAEFPAKSIFVHTYDDPLVSAGQGTDAMELMGWFPHLITSSLVYAVGAGGLGKLAADAHVVRAHNQRARVVGVNREGVPALSRSLRRGRFAVREKEYLAPEVTTAADGTDVPLIGRNNFAHLLQLGKIEAALVTEDEIYEALVFAVSHPWYENRTKLMEGAPAAVLAAALNGALGNLKNQNVVLSMTGSNIDEATMARAFASKGWVAEDFGFYEAITKLRARIRRGVGWIAKKRIRALNQFLANPDVLAGMRVVMSDPQLAPDLIKKLRQATWLALPFKKVPIRLLYSIFPKSFDNVGIVTAGELEFKPGQVRVVDLRSNRDQKHSPDYIDGALRVSAQGHELEIAMTHLSREPLRVIIADDIKTALEVAGRARELGYTRVAVLQGGVAAWHLTKLVGTLGHHAGWAPVMDSDHPSLFGDEKGNIYQVWATAKRELWIRLIRGGADHLTNLFNADVMRRTLAPFAKINLVQADGTPIPHHDHDSLATTLGWHRPPADAATKIRDEHGLEHTLYQDQFGRKFYLVQKNTAEGLSLSIRQYLPHPRHPEVLYPEDFVGAQTTLLQVFPAQKKIELAFHTLDGSPVAGYVPKPQTFERRNGLISFYRTHHEELGRFMASLGIAVPRELAEDPLPVFSVGDGAKTFVAHFRPKENSPQTGALTQSLLVHRYLQKRKRDKIAILVTKVDHCLIDLLENFNRGLLPGEVSVIVSNHAELAPVARKYGITFRHIPVENPDLEESKDLHRTQVLAALKELHINTVVLARYMQRVSAEMISHFGSTNIINVHHGLLPAFSGAQPYYQATDRGVEVIGATAHYVTADIDAGPLIAQEEVRVSSSVATVKSHTDIGRQTEARALTRAVQLHLKNRLKMVNGQVVDMINLTAMMEEQTEVGELHLRQIGNAMTPGGGLKPEDVLAAFAARGADPSLDQIFKQIERIKITNSYGSVTYLQFVNGNWQVFRPNGVTRGSPVQIAPAGRPARPTRALHDHIQRHARARTEHVAAAASLTRSAPSSGGPVALATSPLIAGGRVITGDFGGGLPLVDGGHLLVDGNLALNPDNAPQPPLSVRGGDRESYVAVDGAELEMLGGAAANNDTENTGELADSSMATPAFLTPPRAASRAHLRIVAP